MPSPGPTLFCLVSVPVLTVEAADRVKLIDFL